MFAGCEFASVKPGKRVGRWIHRWECSDSTTITAVIAGGSSTNYVTSFSLGTARNNFSGWVGMSVTVGNTPLTVTALGRMEVAGNTGNHTVQIVNASGQVLAADGDGIDGGRKRRKLPICKPDKPSDPECEHDVLRGEPGDVGWRSMVRHQHDDPDGECRE